MMTTYILSLLLSFLLTVLFTPIVKTMALRFNVIDQPNERKVHGSPIPLMGGVAIYMSFVLSYGIVVWFTDIVATNVGYAVIMGGGLLVFIGIIDDRFGLKPRTKLIVQAAASLVAMYFGLRIQHLSIPFLWEEPIYLGWIGVPITLFWIIGLTNAVNLIDGLDGLSSGVCGIAGVALFFFSLSVGNSLVASMMLLFIGAIFGFLVFNFHPASIFMGDSGSLFLGYALAVITLLELKQATLLAFVIPIFMLSVPVTDTLYAIVRRKINKQPLASPDKNHLHHRLLEKGHSHRRTVLIIYAISALFASLSVLILHVSFLTGLLLVGFYLLFFEIFAEVNGMLDERHRPLSALMNRLFKWRKGDQ
ncbi:undecaprenyl/decaprenyl-phosphate alpha-N-acetylglucosaminyl 1-phosphate transferase (plasmid) [Pontibacillus sp. ALD_SL1]|uniref:glycosyltransferase family 4 protein n=1 Tax=Pontibacillus sp. ALD_SL1 TaxID=2777185 RepID=UPI001A974EA2|nr:MraY family glycosyltransferase [Pontibacillus sp. ALD_SL1]QST02731.1 undecaprenyl/decaprenyl-phosphate alpha-N-acetylglucosaminyl 1-phosphate transferase [Pontibacillus sp. ALD_SL1]